MGPGFQSMLCKKAYLLWYLSDKFYLIAFHGDETPALHYCFVFGRGRLCYCEVDRYPVTSGSLKWMTGPQGDMGPVFEHFVVPTDVRGSPPRVAVTAPGQSTPKLARPLGSQGGDNHHLGTWYLWGAELLPCLAGFPCLAMTLTHKEEDFLVLHDFSCSACTCGVPGLGWMCCGRAAAPWLGWEGRSSGTTGALGKAGISLVLKWVYEHLAPSG